jgi:cephalosporin hydroxylase
MWGDSIKRVVADRAPLLATAAWWYWTLHRQARSMRRAGRDPRTPEQLLAAMAPGATMLTFDGQGLTDPRMTVAPVSAIQRREELLELLRRVQALQPQRLCEIGTSSGGTLYLLTRVAPEIATIVSIDISIPAHTGRARANLGRGAQSVRSLEGDSHDPATVERLRRELAGHPLDFLLIDGDHSYAGVKSDFELYAPLVRPGGLIALHDISPDSGEPGGPISGEVPRYWAELRETHETEEIIRAPSGEGLGIGLVRV